MPHARVDDLSISAWQPYKETGGASWTWLEKRKTVNNHVSLSEPGLRNDVKVSVTATVCGIWERRQTECDAQ